MSAGFRLPSQRLRRLTAVGIAVLCTLAIFWACCLPWQYPSSSLLYKFGINRTLLLLGKSAGMAAACLILIQMMLVSRWRWLERIVSRDRQLAFHRRFGWGVAVLALLHPILIFFPEDLAAIPVSLEYWPEMVGAGLLVALLGTAILTQSRDFAGLPHQVWKIGHRCVAFGLGPALAIHVLFVNDGYRAGVPRAVVIIGAGGFVLLWMWVAFRSLRRVHPHRVEKVSPAGKDAVTLVLNPLSGRQLAHLPGQFAYIRLSSDRLTAEEHPFTIASEPGREEGLCLTIRCAGDWTSRVGRIPKGDTVFVEGPYGHFSPEAYAPASCITFIVAGVGITPALSVLRDLSGKGDRRKLNLIWSNRTRQDMVHSDEMRRLEKRLVGLNVTCLFSRENGSDGKPERIGLELLAQTIGPFHRGHLVFICGPEAFMRQMSQHLRALGYPRSRIKTEAFRM